MIEHVKKIAKFFKKNVVAPKNGTTVINEVIGNFGQHIEKLNQGIQLCETEHKDNTAVIESLNKSNTELIVTKTKAGQFVQNLSKLIPS